MKRAIAFLMTVLMAVAVLQAVPAAAASNSPEYTAVAQMIIKFNCGCSRTGTGTMIAKNGMITCAHNLCCPDHNKKLKSCDFYFGRNNKQYHYKYTGKFTYTYYGDYSGGYKSENDIGYIVFPKDIGTTTGWYASSVEKDDDLKWEFCHMLGYQGNTRVSDWNQVNIVNAREIKWPAAASYKKGGQGGPVYYASSEYEFPVLVAVYSCYTTDDGYARRFTQNVYEDMVKDGVKFTQK